jgi:hypothetical protein
MNFCTNELRRSGRAHLLSRPARSSVRDFRQGQKVGAKVGANVHKHGAVSGDV